MKLMVDHPVHVDGGVHPLLMLGLWLASVSLNFMGLVEHIDVGMKFVVYSLQIISLVFVIHTAYKNRKKEKSDEAKP